MTDERATFLMDDNGAKSSVGARHRLGLILCVGVIFGLCFASSLSPAQTTMELTRWREFSYARQTSQTASTMTGIDAVSRTGFIVLGDGEFGQLSSMLVHTSSPEGKQFCQGFVTYSFKDGASILAKVDVSGDYQGRQTGNIVFLAGTKRFEGVEGRGTISSWMPSQWDMYAEVEGHYSAHGR